jgi:hypothetical protein
VIVVELVGPNVRRFALANDKVFATLALEPKYKLGLKLEDYTPRGAPNLEEVGKNGRVELGRKTPDALLPPSLIFTTSDGGTNWRLFR